MEEYMFVKYLMTFIYYSSEQEHYISLSFATISSVGPNGAVIHYKPEPETALTLNTQEIYLCDSGGQYR